VRFGVAGALRLSSFFHSVTVACLALVGLTAEMSYVYWIGFVMVAAVLAWEHRIVSPNDLSRINRAFFDLNAYVSLGYFLATLVDVVIRLNAGSVQ
jgi:4-hydroxybenzoate polyprenyltransferase